MAYFVDTRLGLATATATTIVTWLEKIGPG